MRCPALTIVSPGRVFGMASKGGLYWGILLMGIAFPIIGALLEVLFISDDLSD